MVGWVASELFPFVENTFPTTFLQTVLASFPAHGFPVILNSTFDHHSRPLDHPRFRDVMMCRLT